MVNLIFLDFEHSSLLQREKYSSIMNIWNTIESSPKFIFKRKNVNKTIKEQNMLVVTKFMFESQLCVGKVLAPPHICFTQQNRLVSFAKKCVSLCYLISYNYCVVFIRWIKGKNFRFFIRVIGDTLNHAPMYPHLQWEAQSYVVFSRK